jgi:hypothetical protein
MLLNASFSWGKMRIFQILQIKLSSRKPTEAHDIDSKFVIE